MDLAEDLLDLDAPTEGSPSRAWRHRHSLLVGAAVLVVVAVLAAVLVWPQPPPTPALLGLREAPVAAWSLRIDEATSFPTTCDGDAMLAVSGLTGLISCLALADGVERWSTQVTTGGAAGEEGELLWAERMVGTDFVRVVTRSQVLLLDSHTGQVRHTIAKPPSEDAFGQAPIFASDRGTLFWTAPSNDPLLSGRLEFSRLREPDPETAAWSVDVGQGELTSGWGLPGPVEYRGYLWVNEPGWGSAAYSVVVRLSDGEVPQWGSELRRMVFHGGSVIGATGGGLVAHDIGSGRRLWQRDVWGERAIVGDDALYAISDSEVQSIDRETGGMVAPVTRIDPRTGRELWRVELPHAVHQLSSFGDYLVAVPESWADSGVLQITGLDPSDGSVAWSIDLGAARLGGLFWGEGQVLLSYLVPDDGVGERSYLIALDSETGETRWETELDGYPAVVGQRLVTFGQSKVQVYR